ncbi:MAG: amidohydrolase family protein, partial [Campylobacterales bacterium]
SPNLKVGISIHSPYSVHPKLIEKGLQIARERGLPVQAHLLESRAEVEWLHRGGGEFQAFFQGRFPFAKPHFTPRQFISLFEGVRVGFVHLTYGGVEELEEIGRIGGGVIHCPISNRLIEGRSFRWATRGRVPVGIGTDGKSSNYTLNLWEEMRVALFLHQEIPPLQLAQELLTGAFYWNRKILGVEGGELRPGERADFLVAQLPAPLHSPEQLPLHLLLQTNQVARLYFRGERLR